MMVFFSLLGALIGCGIAKAQHDRELQRMRQTVGRRSSKPEPTESGAQH